MNIIKSDMSLVAICYMSNMIYSGGFSTFCSHKVFSSLSFFLYKTSHSCTMELIICMPGYKSGNFGFWQNHLINFKMD